MTNNAMAKPKAQRYGSCDLLRFIFSIFIVGNHIYQIGVQGEPFAAARIFVEFFFMVSGYFMVQSFENRAYTVSVEESAKEAFMYTWKKCKSLMCYVIPCMILECFLKICYSIVVSGNFSNVGYFLLKLPMEISMISPLIIGQRSLVPIWYIAAMLITMPLLCFVYLRFRSAFLYIFSWFVPVVYFYINGGIHPVADGVGALLRAFCDMSLGCFVYLFAQYISSLRITGFKRLLISVIEFCCFAIPVFFVSMKNEAQYNLITLLFFIGTAIMMSRRSYSVKINGKFFSYLGKLSLPIYTLHWCIGSLVWLIHSITGKFGYPISMTIRIVLFYALTIIGAIIFCFIVEKIKKRKLAKKVN